MTTPPNVDLARRIVKLERGLKNLPAAGHSAVVELGKLSLKDLRSRLKAAEEKPMVVADYAPARTELDEDSVAVAAVAASMNDLAVLRPNPKPLTAPTSAQRAANVLAANRWRNAFIPDTETLSRQVRRRRDRIAGVA